MLTINLYRNYDYAEATFYETKIISLLLKKIDWLKKIIPLVNKRRIG